MAIKIIPATLEFLTDLRSNNTREWFAENKSRYEDAKANVKQFVAELEMMLNEHDAIEESKVFRIYRDVRFSKDKTPYKTNIGVGFTRATAARRGGCYLNIEPGNMMIGGGFWGPSSADLKRIRYELAHDAEPMRALLSSKSFVDNFGALQGDALKTAPKGYAKDHPNVDLLRYKQFLLSKTFSDKEVTKADFMEKCSEGFRAMRPFFDYMSMVLTTNENGESIL